MTIPEEPANSGSASSAGRPRERRLWIRILGLSLPAWILAASLYLPFLTKAYAIDDPYFLLQSQQARRELLHPSNFTLCWFDSLHCAKAYRLAPGSALTAYLLIPVLAWTSAEPVIHLSQLLFLLAAVPATVSLALRLGNMDFEARCAGMLLVCFPPVLAMTNTVMPDVVVMALGVIGVDRFLAWLDKGKLSNAAAAALPLGLAPFGRMHAIGLIGVAALLGFLHSRAHAGQRISAIRAALPLALAAALFAGLTFLTRESGALPALPPEFNLGLGNVESNARAFLVDFFVCFPLAVFWLIHMRRRAAALLLLAAASFGILSWGGLPRGGAVTWTLAVLSLACFSHLFWLSARDRSPRLALLAWLLVPCFALPYIHLPPKYVMIGAPAAAIVAVGLLRNESTAIRRFLSTAAIASCAIVSILVLQADRRFAEPPRQAAAELVAPSVQRGQRVWFAGHWGIYWYAAQAGATVVEPGVKEPVPGDLLLTEQFENRDPILDRYPRRELIATRVFSWSGGRIMSHRYHAGLYSNRLGLLPWSYGAGEVDRFELWRID